MPGDQAVDVPPYPILARDDVRHVGDAIAFVVADTLDQARDAAEAIAVDWEPLPHVIGAAAALQKDAPLVWPEASAQQSRFRDELGDAEATARGFCARRRTPSR